MKNRVAARFSGVERSATVALLELVQTLRAQGVSIVDLGVVRNVRVVDGRVKVELPPTFTVAAPFTKKPVPPLLVTTRLVKPIVPQLCRPGNPS